MISTERRLAVYKYLDTPVSERKLTPLEFRKEIRLSAKAWKNLKADWLLRQKHNQETERARNLLGDILKGEATDDDIALIQKIRAMDEAVFEAATVKNIAKMAELWYKRQGLLVEKSEQKVTLELSASEHFRIRQEARKRISEVSGTTNGDRGLLPEQSILPQEVWENKGQD